MVGSWIGKDKSRFAVSSCPARQILQEAVVFATGARMGIVPKLSPLIPDS